MITRYGFGRVHRRLIGEGRNQCAQWALVWSSFAKEGFYPERGHVQIARAASENVLDSPDSVKRELEGEQSTLLI